MADAFGSSVPGSATSHALQKGGGDDAAREAVLKHLGIDGSKGQLSRDFKTQQLENNMGKSGDAFGPKANETASEFMARQDGQIAAAKGIPTGGTLDQGDAASQILDAVRQAHTDSRAGYRKLYDDAFSLPGSFEPAMFNKLGTRIEDQLTSRPQAGGGPVLVDQWNTPKAYSVMQRLDDGRVFRPDASGEIPLQHVDGVRKMFTTAISDSGQNPSDRRALQAMLGQFDDHLSQGQSYGLYRGDPRALDLLNQGRAAYADHASRFGKSGAGDGAGNFVRRMVDEKVPVSVEDVSKALFGVNKLSSSTTQNNLADKVERITGNMTPWKQAAWGQTVGDIGQHSPQVAAKRIDAFLTSDVAKRFTTTERAQMRQVQKGLEIVSDNIVRGTSSNARPDTSTNLASILGAGKDMMKGGGLGGVLGFGVGGIPGAIGGAAANAIGNKVVNALSNRSNAKLANRLFGDLPNYAPTTAFRSPMASGLLGADVSDEAISRLRR